MSTAKYLVECSGLSMFKGSSCRRVLKLEQYSPGLNNSGESSCKYSSGHQGKSLETCEENVLVSMRSRASFQAPIACSHANFQLHTFCTSNKGKSILSTPTSNGEPAQ